MPVLLDPDHLHGVQIDDRAQSLDRANVAVVGRIGAKKAERPGKPPGAVFFGSIIPRAPDIDHDQARVVHARVPLEGLAKLGAGQDGLLALDLLVDRHRGLDAGDVLPADAAILVGQRDRRLVTGVGGVVEEHGKRLTRRSPIAARVVHEALVRLPKRDRHEPRGCRDLAASLEDGDRGADFLGRERFQRMACGKRRDRLAGRDRDQGGHGISWSGTRSWCRDLGLAGRGRRLRGETASL